MALTIKKGTPNNDDRECKDHAGYYRLTGTIMSPLCCGSLKGETVRGREKGSRCGRYPTRGISLPLKDIGKRCRSHQVWFPHRICQGRYKGRRLGPCPQCEDCPGDVLTFGDYDADGTDVRPTEHVYFDGYRRSDGKAGIRNGICIIPTVGMCEFDCQGPGNPGPGNCKRAVKM